MREAIAITIPWPSAPLAPRFAWHAAEDDVDGDVAAGGAVHLRVDGAVGAAGAAGVDGLGGGGVEEDGFGADGGGGGGMGRGGESGRNEWGEGGRKSGRVVRLGAEEGDGDVVGIGGGGGRRVGTSPSRRVQGCAEIEAEGVAGEGR